MWIVWVMGMVWTIWILWILTVWAVWIYHLHGRFRHGCPRCGQPFIDDRPRTPRQERPDV